MNPASSKASKRKLWIAACALGIWLLGFLMMDLPVGDPVARIGYDYLHVFTSHPPISRVVLIVINEGTDRKLNRPAGQPLSRHLHAQLLARLTRAGAERVYYDILFDQPSPDPSADEAFRSAIKAHGRVVLGGVEQVMRQGEAMTHTAVVPPLQMLREVAEGWGLLNVAPVDPDGVVRRIGAESGAFRRLASVAARAQIGPGLELPTEGAWYYYQVMPGTLPTIEFADSLSSAVVPDEVLRGQTVFIGGSYSSLSGGRPDSFRTPYARFGAPDIPGVAWHALAFANLRDSLWIVSAGRFWNAIWSALFPALWAVVCLKGRRSWLVALVSIAVALLLLIACIYWAWNGRMLINWPVIGVVQLPLALALTPFLRPPAPRKAVLIFVSAVTDEFGSYRAALLRELDRPNVSVKVQENFITSGASMLTKLDEYIRACHCVIHLAGNMTGRFPEEADVAALMHRYPDFGRQLPVLRKPLESGERFSYTQWEAYLAKYHRKLLIAALPIPDSQRDSNFPFDASQRGAQEHHLDRLKGLAASRIRFENVDKLIIAILRSELQGILENGRETDEV